MPVDIGQRASGGCGNSLLHRCDARIIIVLLTVTILTTALLPNGAWAVYLLMAGLLLVIVLLSEMPIVPLLKRGFLLEIPILLVLLPQLFLKSGHHVQISPFAGFAFSLSLTGLDCVTNLLVRSALSLQFAVVILSVTSFDKLLTGLRALGLPRLLIAILALMWRYLFVFQDEVHRLSQARLACSAAPQGSSRHIGGSLVWRACVTGGMAGTLMLRSLDRSERLYQAMLARGYDGELRVQEGLPPLDPSQCVLLMVFVLIGALLLWIAYGIAG